MTSPLPFPLRQAPTGLEGILSEGLLLGVVFITARAAHLPWPLVVIGKGPLPACAREAARRRVPPEMTLAGDTLGRHLARLGATIILFLFRARFSLFPFCSVSRSLSLRRGPASRNGDGAGGSCSCPPFIRLFLSLSAPPPPFAYGNFPSSPAGSFSSPPRPQVRVPACVASAVWLSKVGTVWV